jgi:hypothetical protein
LFNTSQRGFCSSSGSCFSVRARSRAPARPD